jgi:hypothetical protein
MKEVTIPINSDFKEICKKIVDRELSETQWSEVESDDMFQSDSFEGGFDATENAFTFSYYTSEKEYWFQLTLEDILKVHNGQELILQGTLAGTLADGV